MTQDKVQRSYTMMHPDDRPCPVYAVLLARHDALAAELAALRKRIADAPIAKVRGKVGEFATIVVSHDMAGQRVRLVPDGVGGLTVTDRTCSANCGWNCAPN